MPKQEGRTATKDLLIEVGLIKVKTDELREIVKALPDSSVKDAFIYSVINLERKIARFTLPSEKIILSDEEKEFIIKFRAEKISATSGVSGEPKTSETAGEQETQVLEVFTPTFEILKKQRQKKH